MLFLNSKRVQVLSVYHSPPKFYVTVDINLNEEAPSLATTYLQGKGSILEDKNWDFLLHLSLLPISGLIPILVPKHAPEILVNLNSVVEPMPTPMSEAVLETSISCNSASENAIFGKVHSRKRTIVSELVKVDESSPNSENEVTISNSLQAETESHVGNDDQYLLIAIKKGIRVYKTILYSLIHFLSFKHFSSSQSLHG